MYIRSTCLCVLVMVLPTLLFGQDLEERVKRLEEIVGDSESPKPGTVVADLRALTDLVTRGLEQQRNILNEISRTDSAGNRILSISENMTRSADFRQDVSQAVHDSIKRTGTVTLTNKTGTYQRITVNRVDYGLQAGEERRVDVPVGTVTTQLPGEELKNWTVGTPNYEQRIDIVPTTTTFYRWTTYYPGTTYVYPLYTPIYVEPLIYYSY